MRRFIRNIAIYATIPIVGGFVGFPASRAAHAEDAIRLSWQDFAKDPNRIAAFRKAVATMKALNSADHASVQYRQSWEYWANIHGYFGPDSPFGTVAQNRDFVQQNVPAAEHFFDGITDNSPPDQVAIDIWANCQHGTPWFFAWHRMYLLYFEKQLQTAAGDPTLRLPYWDYTDPQQVSMPAEFTQPTYKDSSGADQPNPLYEPRRDPAWQQATVTLDPNSTNIDRNLTEGNFTRYQSGIENNIHAYIHCTVAAISCPVPDMGAVPYSSNDPIFWLHHANIDRFWSCWSNIPGHKNPTNDSNFVGRQFSFVDQTGQETTNSVGDLFNGQFVDYKYEKETNCARTGATLVAENNEAPPTAAEAPAAETTAARVTDLLAQGRTLNAATGPVSLSAATTKVIVELRKDNEMKTITELALGARAPVKTVTHLTLSGITFAAPPGAQFNVFLEDSANPGRREYAGTISFFNAVPSFGTHNHNHAEALATPGGPGLTREFDVTDALRKLAGGKPDLSSVTVAFQATTGRVGSNETAEVNAKANVTVSSLAFKVSPVEP